MPLRALVGIVVVLVLDLAVFALILAGTLSLTSIVLERTGQHPAPLLVQIANGVLALLFLLLLLMGIGSVIARRFPRRDAGLFGKIIDALGRIAKGDFDVRLDARLRDHALVGGLANSVNQVAAELGELERMRQEFIANVSHEIQSPLTSIRGFAEALQSDALTPDERRQYLSIIETESTRLSRVAADLLKLAALDSERPGLSPKLYRLDKQLRNVILAAEPLWTRKRLELDVALDEVWVTGDEDLLSEVWVNLLHNSIKFTPDAGRVSVSLYQKDGHVAVVVRDTGAGIQFEDQPHVFERFYKADKARDRAAGGSGLGLAIAKRIVELHRGTIALESAPSEGTTIRVDLPPGP